MTRRTPPIALGRAAVAASIAACTLASANRAADVPDVARPPAQLVGPDPKMADPYATKSVNNNPKVTGWPAGKAPVAAAGLAVNAFARDLENPRTAYVLPDGSVLVAESNTNKRASANRVRRLVDGDKDGVAEAMNVFADGLKQPFGMTVIGDWFYVANTDAVLRWPYKPGQAKVEGEGQKILDLPADGYNNHWTRNLVASADGKKLYVTVGSATNVDEKLDQDAKDPRRAAVLVCDPDGSNARVYAGGLRNPAGVAIEPTTGVVWAAVNERDEIGDDIAPDYMTSVKEGAFYGWPYAYWGKHEDPRHKGARPDLVAKSLTPDYALGAHTASLGLAFATGNTLTDAFRSGAFVGQHGSWNRAELTGYRVLYVPFKAGKTAGPPVDVLAGFVSDAAKREVYGRPVGVTTMADGSLLVCDDSGNTVWRVAAKK
ncbi:MAG: L-sorbosone dehydrogenase [Phycisphaerales bacterium]|nr:L-sorbosone dehydrogenase [Phycisphaerales bacterium]